MSPSNSLTARALRVLNLLQRYPGITAGEWLAAVPFPFTIEGGPELRDAVTALARRLTRSVNVPAVPAPTP